MAWKTTYGPVAIPPRALVVFAAMLIIAVGLGGGVLGFRASFRGNTPIAPGSPESVQDQQAVDAKPIVDLPPVTAPAPEAAANAIAAPKKPVADDTNNVEAKVAQAEAAQSKPSQKQPSADDILTSPTEKPQAPAKPSIDETAPATPAAKTDVPF